MPELDMSGNVSRHAIRVAEDPAKLGVDRPPGGL